MKFGIVCFKLRQTEGGIIIQAADKLRQTEGGIIIQTADKLRQTEGGIIIQTADKSLEMRKILNICEES
jgi:co-chaperonin GroES (HSP10)